MAIVIVATLGKVGETLPLLPDNILISGTGFTPNSESLEMRLFQAMGLEIVWSGYGTDSDGAFSYPYFELMGGDHIIPNQPIPVFWRVTDLNGNIATAEILIET